RRVNISGNTAGDGGSAIHNAAGTVDGEENWWGTNALDPLPTQQAAIEALMSGTVDFDSWCRFEDCVGELTVTVNGPFGAVTSSPAGIDATFEAPSTATFEVPRVVDGTAAITLTLDPGLGAPEAWVWTPVLGDGGVVTLGPALSSGADEYTATYQPGEISVGENATEIAGADLTRLGDGIEAATITVQLRDEYGSPIQQAAVEVRFTTTGGLLGDGVNPPATEATVTTDP